VVAVAGRQVQPARGGRLQAGQMARGEQLHPVCRRDRRSLVTEQTRCFEQAARLPGHRLSGGDQLHPRADQGLQGILRKHIVGATQHQGVDLSCRLTEGAQLRRVLAQQPPDFGLGAGLVLGQGALLDGQGQAIAGADAEIGRALQAREQALEFLAGHGATGGHDAHTAGAAELGRRLDGGLHPDQGQLRVVLTQFVNGRCRGRVAGHHQRLDAVFPKQVLGDGQAALAHEQVGLFAVGRMAVVGQVDKAFVRQLRQQGLQHTEAADATVENADGTLGHGVRSAGFRGACVAASGRSHQRRVQPALTEMPLNSPDLVISAMRCCHSAGPVMWALVPPASTATVTGMSSTSNS